MRWFLFIAFYVLIDIYAFQAVRVLSKSHWVLAAYLVISLLVLGNFIYQFSQPSPGGTFSGPRAYAFGYLLAFMLGKLVVLIFMFGEDLVRMLIALFNKGMQPSSGFVLPERRKFLGQLALGIAAVPFLSLLYGMYRGKYNYKVLKYTLTFNNLPEAFDGYRITQISDIHSGSFDNKEKVEYGIDLINAQKGDVILFTGDLVNNKAKEMHTWKESFSKLKAPHGIYSVLGNHDYGDYVEWPSEKAKAENLEELKNIQAEMGWDLMLNEHRHLEKDGEKIALVGVQNWGKGGFKKKGDLDKAGEGLHPDEFKILMSHDPSYWQEKIKSDPQNYQLTLSGHTHGMQFGIEIPGFFKWSPIEYRYKNWAGIYIENERYINVNRGFGYLAYPGRVGIWPEVTVIELRKGTTPA